MKRAKRESEPITLSPCQIVAWNLEELRRRNRWSQAEAAKRLEPYLGYAMSRAAWSKMERSWKGGQIRRFDADEILAFARVFYKPVAYFFCVPMSHYQKRPVVVNGKPGQPKAAVSSEPLSARAMTAISGRAWLPGVETDPQGIYLSLWRLACQSFVKALNEALEEDPRLIDDVRSGSAKGLQELLNRIDSKILMPEGEANLERDFSEGKSEPLQRRRIARDN